MSVGRPISERNRSNWMGNRFIWKGSKSTWMGCGQIWSGCSFFFKGASGFSQLKRHCQPLSTIYFFHFLYTSITFHIIHLIIYGLRVIDRISHLSPIYHQRKCPPLPILLYNTEVHHITGEGSSFIRNVAFENIYHPRKGGGNGWHERKRHTAAGGFAIPYCRLQGKGITGRPGDRWVTDAHRLSFTPIIHIFNGKQTIVTDERMLYKIPEEYSFLQRRYEICLF